MIGHKKPHTTFLGVKNNFHRHLGEKMSIQGSSKFSIPRSPQGQPLEIHNEQHTEYEPKVKHNSQQSHNVLRVKKENKPNDGFSNFV
jgi:hypothetical protein